MLNYDLVVVGGGPAGIDLFAVQVLRQGHGKAGPQGAADHGHFCDHS